MLLHNVYMIEEDYTQNEKDFLCAIRKGLFMLVAILATGLGMYLIGGWMSAIIAECFVVGTASIMEFINEWSE